MNKTIVILGYIGAGKDLAIKYISDKYNIPIAISNTTRPMRENETQGVEYNFMSKEEFDTYEYPIPPRVYHTVHGDWYYGTSKEVENKIVILDFGGYKALCDYLGGENVIGVLITSNLLTLKKRALQRGDNPKEVERRLSDDIIKFKGAEKEVDYVLRNDKDIYTYKSDLDKMMDEIYEL